MKPSDRIEENRKEFEEFCENIPATYEIIRPDGTIDLGIDGATTEEISNWWLSRFASLLSAILGEIGEEESLEKEVFEKEPFSTIQIFEHWSERRIGRNQERSRLKKIIKEALDNLEK